MQHNKTKINGWSSIAVHGGHQQDPNSAHITPIYATSTFTFDSAEEGMERFASLEKEKVYSRWGNPTFKEAEEKIAALECFGISDEDGDPLQLKALLHASGQAAMATLFFSTLTTGDKILSHHSLYGGTHELLHRVLASSGIEPIIADLRNPQVLDDILAKDESIRLIHIETPANPTIQCTNIAAVTALAKKYGRLVSVDNTFATPFLQQPFNYGVDFVLHSTTKFLNGHGTAIGGVLLGKDIQFMKTKAWKWHALLGGNANPFDAFMLTQGIKTLELRMLRHCDNAMKVATYLNAHPVVSFVNYTGLKSHPDYEVCKLQMKHPGPMLSFELKGGLAAGKLFINKLQLCTRAVSLGTLDTLVSHPASMSHAGVSSDERMLFGITDGLIRMSIGIENIDDLLNDLQQALA